MGHVVSYAELVPLMYACAQVCGGRSLVSKGRGIGCVTSTKSAGNKFFIAMLNCHPHKAMNDCALIHNLHVHLGVHAYNDANNFLPSTFLRYHILVGVCKHVCVFFLCELLATMYTWSRQ